MPYITSDEFAKRFSEEELSELTGDDATVFTAAEADAAALIDGYINARYTLPLLVVPQLVKAWSLDLTRFNLWDERSPEEVRLRRDDALDQLVQLSRGTIHLPPDVNGVVPAAGVDVAYYSADRVFTSETLAGY